MGWEASHGKLAKLHVELCQNHTAIEQRMAYIEQMLGDSADKHAKLEAGHSNLRKLQKEQEARGAHHAAMQERITYLENAIGDSADKHAKWEASHGKLAKLHNEHSQNHAAVEQRISYIEEMLGDTADKHAKWEAAHGAISRLQRELEARTTQHDLLLDRVTDNHEKHVLAMAELRRHVEKSAGNHEQYVQAIAELRNRSEKSLDNHDRLGQAFDELRNHADDEAMAAASLMVEQRHMSERVQRNLCKASRSARSLLDHDLAAESSYALPTHSLQDTTFNFAGVSGRHLQ